MVMGVKEGKGGQEGGIELELVILFL